MTAQFRGVKALPNLTTGLLRDTMGARHYDIMRSMLFSTMLGIGGHHMRWICDETGEAYEFPISEPPSQPTYCLCCGKTHNLTPGELNDYDRKQIEMAKRVAQEDIDFEAALSEAWAKNSSRFVRGKDYSY